MNLSKVTPLSQNVVKLNKPNKKETEQESQQQSTQLLTSPQEIIGRSMITFGGKIPFLDKLDKKFLEHIVEELNIPKEKLKSLQETLENFLTENKLKSLSDIGGEENLEIQVELQNQLSRHIDLDESDSEYLATEIIDRCDSGDKYVPKPKSEVMEGINQFENLIRASYLEQGERKFIKAIADDFGLSRDKVAEVEDLINEFLKENNLKSLHDLADDEDRAIELEAVLSEKLGAKLDLSDNDSDTLTFELINWVMSNKRTYVPETSALDTHFDIFDFTCESFKLSDNIERDLYHAMKREAMENGYSNIFECFHKNPDFVNSEVAKILNSIKDEDARANLIIELASYADEASRTALNLPKHIQRDRFYGKLSNEFIIEKLQEEFHIPKYLAEDIKSLIEKRHPKYIEGGSETSIEQIAYELADKYHLDVGAESRIKQIITDVDNLPTVDLEKFLLDKLLGRS